MARFYKLLFYTIFLFFSVQLAYAQPGKKNIGDLINIKAPEVKSIEIDTNVIDMEEGDVFDLESDQAKSIFDPRKTLNLVSEDTSTIDEGEISIVEVSEEVNMDSVWVKIAEYYAIWDSRSVNPYRIDHTNFKDTVALTLYDSTESRYWSPPLRKTHVTSDFGARWSRWHYGTDLELDTGDSVFAVFDGVVRVERYDGRGYGNYALIRHYNGIETLYGHLSKTLVEVGQYVKAGDLIGWGGSTGRSTGPHLHFEVRFEGTPIDAEDLYDFAEGQLISQKLIITNENFKYLGKRRQVFFHTVRNGDTLGRISKKYRVPISRICKLNGISSRSTLRVGKRLRIK